MKSNDSLGDRMKGYEIASRNSLTKRIPVIVRVDGKAFHTFCKRFERPYDAFLNDSLNQSMKYVCERVQGVKFAERHSDELSFLLTDFDTIQTDAYFEYSVQKMVSVIASMVTGEFCKAMTTSLARNDYLSWSEDWPSFDARAFNIPESDVVNYFLWRQKDCLRNGLSMLSQSLFSHKELQGKNSSDMQEMLFSKHNINWNDVEQYKKTGFLCKKERKTVETENGIGYRNKWVICFGARDRQELDYIISSIPLVKE